MIDGSTRLITTSLRSATIVVLSMEMMLRQIKAFFRGGLGDLMGHIPGGLGKICQAVPVTYGYPVHWQTRQPINYHEVRGATYLFPLDVDMHWPAVRYTADVFIVDCDGVQTYLICPAQGMFEDPQGDYLYPSDSRIAIRQAAFFGRAAEALLMRLGIRPDIAWYQEWRPAITAMPSMMVNPHFAGMKHLYTSHTCRPEALLKCPADWWHELCLADRFISYFISDGCIDTDRGCVALADMVNGVSDEHAEVLRAIYPEYASKIVGCMNGTSRAFALSTRLQDIDDPSRARLALAHWHDKSKLIELVRQKTGEQWTIEDYIVGLVRRLAEYKNQFRMFKSTVFDLVNMGAKVLIGGVAHESDAGCRQWMRLFLEMMEDSRLKGRFVYIPEYNEEFRLLAAQGSDTWVECPWERSEACGTSPFLAKINGNLIVATCGGGIKEHGTLIDPAARTGDTLFIDPDNPETLAVQIGRMSSWYFNWLRHDDQLWMDLRKYAFNKGKLLDVDQMMERYIERCFAPLLTLPKTSNNVVPFENARAA